MKFKYEVDAEKLALSREELIKVQENGQKLIFEQFITNLLGMKHKEGIKGPTVRLLDKLLDKLDEATDGTIDIGTAEAELLSGVLMDESLAIHPKQVRLISLLRKNLEAALQG